MFSFGDRRMLQARRDAFAGVPIGRPAPPHAARCANCPVWWRSLEPTPGGATAHRVVGGGGPRAGSLDEPCTGRWYVVRARLKRPRAVRTALGVADPAGRDDEQRFAEHCLRGGSDLLRSAAGHRKGEDHDAI